MEDQLKLIITEDDFTEKDRETLIEEQKRIGILGNGDAVRAPFFNAISRIIVRKISEISCPGFSVAEVSLEISVSGKVFGTGFDGKASVKLTRDPTTSE